VLSYRRIFPEARREFQAKLALRILVEPQMSRLLKLGGRRLLRNTTLLELDDAPATLPYRAKPVVLIGIRQELKGFWREAGNGMCRAKNCGWKRRNVEPNGPSQLARSRKTDTANDHARGISEMYCRDNICIRSSDYVRRGVGLGTRLFIETKSDRL